MGWDLLPIFSNHLEGRRKTHSLWVTTLILGTHHKHGVHTSTVQNHNQNCTVTVQKRDWLLN